MNSKNTLLLFLCFISGVTYGQDLVLPLWPEGIPCSNEHEMVTKDQGPGRGLFLSKVHTPDIAVYKPERPNGTAVLICPGGGYAVLAYDWEGTEFAKWFNALGITAVVLKYRLPHWESEECRDKVALPDAQQAMRLIRQHASEWNVNPQKVGVMGFSAGGHLASTLSTHYDLGDQSSSGSLASISCKPDFSILVYPVISMDPGVTHNGSRNNLIGKNPSQEMLDYFSNDLQVNQDTPPTLLIHASDDKGVPVENSIRYYQNLIKNNVPASMHIYETGGHGFAMAKGKEGAVSKWLTDCKNWLIERGLL